MTKTRKIKVTDALMELLSSQIEDACAYREAGDEYSTLYVKLADNEGRTVELTENERHDLWQVCDYIDECWEDDPQSRRVARRWRARVACQCDVRT